MASKRMTRLYDHAWGRLMAAGIDLGQIIFLWIDHSEGLTKRAGMAKLLHAAGLKCKPWELRKLYGA